jgi:signal transduction histidine kinase
VRSNTDASERAATRIDSSLGTAVRVGLAAVVVAAFLVDLWVMGDGPSRATTLSVIGIAISALIWARWPNTTIAVAAVVPMLSLVATLSFSRDSLRFALFTEFVTMPVLFGVLLMRPSRLRCSLAGLVAVAGAAICLRIGATPIRAIVAMSMLVLLGAAGTAVVYIRLRDSERRVSIDIARQNERLELARELHDVVGHHVTGIVVLVQATRFTASSQFDHATIEETMAAIETAGLDTLISIRRLVGLLRTDAPLVAPPGLSDIELLAAELRRTHVLTELDVDDQLRTTWVPADLATTIQRLTQEAVTNVRRHGDPTKPVVLSFSCVESRFNFLASNTPLVDALGQGFGLIGMRERIDALGGTFSATREGGRWVVRAALPLETTKQTVPSR